jgi:hypothetical protein
VLEMCCFCFIFSPLNLSLFRLFINGFFSYSSFLHRNRIERVSFTLCFNFFLSSAKEENKSVCVLESSIFFFCLIPLQSFRSSGSWVCKYHIGTHKTNLSRTCVFTIFEESNNNKKKLNILFLFYLFYYALASSLLLTSFINMTKSEYKKIYIQPLNKRVR